MAWSSAEKSQFRALTRLFAYRFLDTDLLPARGEISALLSQLAALLAAVSLVVCVIVAQAYVTGNPPPEAAWGQAEFLFSTTMAVVAIFTLLLWEALFPDRRDSLVLGVLPVRARTIWAAKAAAAGVALGLAALAVNAFTGIVFPVFLLRGAGLLGMLRCLAAYWIAVAAASAFAFGVFAGLQGVAIHLLPDAVFQRVSSLLQGAAFFGVLAIYFLAPPLAAPAALSDPANVRWYAVLPSYWFLGLFETLNGSGSPLFAWLARRAALGTAAVTAISAGSFVLAYGRQMRRAVERYGIARRSERRGRLFDRAAGTAAADPGEHGLLTFIARTMGRSRQHRALIAMYAGLGMAYIFSGIASVIYHAHSFTGADRMLAATGIPVTMLFFLVVGIRIAFAIPVEVRANVVFRVTDAFGSRAWFTAARKALLAFAVAPVLLVSAAAYGVFWPFWKAAGHLMFLTVVGLLLVETALRKWDKIPFACSYLPGKANWKVMFGVYALLFWSLSQVLVLMENAALGTPRGYAVMMLVATAGWRMQARRGAEARSMLAGLRFEEAPESPLTSLGLAGAASRRPPLPVVAPASRPEAAVLEE